MYGPGTGAGAGGGRRLRDVESSVTRGRKTVGRYLLYWTVQYGTVEDGTVQHRTGPKKDLGGKAAKSSTGMGERQMVSDVGDGERGRENKRESREREKKGTDTDTDRPRRPAGDGWTCLGLRRCVEGRGDSPLKHAPGPLNEGG